MRDTARLERICELVAKQTGYPLGKINPSARLLEDIGADGDDAVELMEAFMEEFHVDMNDFRLKEHFGPEAGSPLLGAVLGVGIATSIAHPGLILLWLVAGYGAFQWIKRRSAQSGPGAIRVQDLLESAESGEWTFHYGTDPGAA